jgi:hypothetical protein
VSFNKFLISHRGNVNGPNADKENHPDYIIQALQLGYNVEIDVWYTNNNWYLGHDNPVFEIKYMQRMEMHLIYYCNITI